MAHKMLSYIDFDRPGTIVEIGAGTGAVTEHIVDRLRPHHRFVAVDNDPDFVNVLRRRFPDQTVLLADASRLAEPLSHFGITHVRYVISCIPTPALPRRAILRLTRWVAQALAPDGLYVQLTLAPLIYRRFYRRMFERVAYAMVWKNVPPGGVYVCGSPRGTMSRRD